MAYKSLYKKSVYRDLKKLGTTEAKKVISKLERELSKKADSYPVLKGQFAGLRKYRFSDYRVIYALLDEEVIVLRVGASKRHLQKGNLGAAAVMSQPCVSGLRPSKASPRS